MHGATVRSRLVDRRRILPRWSHVRSHGARRARRVARWLSTNAGCGAGAGADTQDREMRSVQRSTGPPNKRMQLTKLRAAPVLQAEVPPCAPAGRTDGGTASQLIRGVRQI